MGANALRHPLIILTFLGPQFLSVPLLVILALSLTPPWVFRIRFLLSPNPASFIFGSFVVFALLWTMIPLFFWLTSWSHPNLTSAILFIMAYRNLRSIASNSSRMPWLRRCSPACARRTTFLHIVKDCIWLPVEQRIIYKLATLTFKALNSRSPSYFFELLHPVARPSRNLRSNDLSLLSIPRFNSAAGRRSFSFSGPTVWNSLPLELRQCRSFAVFCSKLKTHLFPPWFNSRCLWTSGFSTWLTPLSGVTRQSTGGLAGWPTLAWGVTEASLCGETDVKFYWLIDLIGRTNCNNQLTCIWTISCSNWCPTGLCSWSPVVYSLYNSSYSSAFWFWSFFSPLCWRYSNLHFL